MDNNLNIRQESENMEISFLLPCLNEARTLLDCIRECQEAIRLSGVVGEVVVSDNGSTDGSQDIVKESGAKLVCATERGYGSTLICGIAAVKGRYVLIGDSDMSYNFLQMPLFLKKLHKGYDLVVGCRMPKGGGEIKSGAMPILHRYLGNPFLSWLGRLLFKTQIVDFHCGLRAFDREKILSLNLKYRGMEFASEMIVKSKLAGLKIAQVPVTLRRDGRKRNSHLNTWGDGWKHLRFMLLHAPRWLFLYPGVALCLLSALVFGWLAYSPVLINGIRFDTNTLMISSVGILIGFQILTFGLVAEIVSARSLRLPQSFMARKILKIGPFETGIFAGLGFFIAGLICLSLAFIKWKNVGFGNLSYPDTLRLVIPAVTAISLGVQVVFGGFLLGIFGSDEDQL
ncbi:MAG: glycosyltransferase family 2 protein [Candidatus Taylorbacteria bacterium]|nr:glycosyltransferase family 2 protein [Candidatus Taylorbacteria bacterium]